jgi:hypothetical protein
MAEDQISTEDEIKDAEQYEAPQQTLIASARRSEVQQIVTLVRRGLGARPRR